MVQTSLAEADYWGANWARERALPRQQIGQGVSRGE